MSLAEVLKHLGPVLVQRQLVKGEDGRDEGENPGNGRARVLLCALDHEQHNGTCNGFDAAHRDQSLTGLVCLIIHTWKSVFCRRFLLGIALDAGTAKVVE